MEKVAILTAKRTKWPNGVKGPRPLAGFGGRAPEKPINHMQRLTPLPWLILALTLAACAAPAPPQTAAEAPTLTPFGTVQAVNVNAAEVDSSPPATTPPRQCVFPVNLGEELGVHESGLYRFTWQGIPQTLQTRGGPLTIAGGPGMALGERQIVIVHSAPLPETLRLNDNFAPRSTLLVELLGLTREIRAAGGRILAQTLSDPLGDVRGLPANLDILTVARLFGAGDDFILRVTLAAPDDGEYIWTFESTEALLGAERYASRVFAEGKILSLVYDAEGEVADWPGTTIIQGPTVTWTFENGGELPFGAQTTTSAAGGDQTEMYPVDMMAEIWAVAQRSCGL